MSQRDRLHAKLNDGLVAMNLPVPDSAVAQLLDYLALLERWNKAYNLTAVRDPGEMVTRHILDSLSIARYVSGANLVDLGSGAGLPGIPLAILAPQREVVVVDSNGKKARFLREVVRALKLANVRVAESRVEQVDGRFECITARALATLADMLHWGGHLLADHGRWLALKGKVADDELAALPSGFRVEAVHTLQVPGLDAERHLVVIAKVFGEHVSI